MITKRIEELEKGCGKECNVIKYIFGEGDLDWEE